MLASFVGIRQPVEKRIQEKIIRKPTSDRAAGKTVTLGTQPDSRKKRRARNLVPLAHG